jgi:DNA topoisomerase VI subunit A
MAIPITFKHTVRTSQEPYGTHTVRTSQDPYGTHRYSPYLTGSIRNTQIQSVPHRIHTEHTDTARTSQDPYGTHRYSPYLTGTIRNTKIQSVPHRNHTEHTDTLCGLNAEFLDVKADGTYIYLCALEV